MTMVINGSGTITGLSAGGLPDGSVTAAELASGAARANFGAGAVLQVVQGTYSTQVSTASTTPVDTGLTATITPTSATSKILVLVTQNGLFKGSSANQGSTITLVRNGTAIFTVVYVWGYTSTITNIAGSASNSYLDSPATTSALTYKTQFAIGGGVQMDAQRDSAETSTITLMEIAA